MLHWLLHVTGGDNGSGPFYLEWSGFLPDLTMLSLLGAALHHIGRHNCHVKGCLSIFTHLDPKVHAPACRRHHSYRHLRGRAAA